MLSLSIVLSWWKHVVTAVILYFLSLAFYRLTLHPLARFPGPKLAAISRWYEAYYDVIQNGQYTFKIKELHKVYGPIIRISPYELHVSDPAFFKTLYRQDAHYDKYAWANDAFGADGATIHTAPHHLHRARRQPLSPFFSKSKVANQQDLIRRYVDKLCYRISNFARAGSTFDLGIAATAFTRDVADDFVLHKSYGSLDREDFDSDIRATGAVLGRTWRMSKHMPWLASTLRKIPPDWIVKYADDNRKKFMEGLMETLGETKKLMAAATSPHRDDNKDPPTVVHAIIDSKLPPSDKEFMRIFVDLAVVRGAGVGTTASALRMIFFHLFSNPDILRKLRAELTKASFSPDQIDLNTLQQLPYLTGVLMEGLRLSPAIASRMARISPNTDIVYNKWHIPPGTPVGMTLILMHTDETLYPEPERFNPDRWMHMDARKVDATFAPFSRGTRICLGMHLAWAEMYMLVAALTQSFDFRFPEASAEDFECVCDNFSIGTRGRGSLKAIATLHKD